MFSELLRLSKHSIIYGLAAACSGAIGFFLLPIYTRYLTPEDYGVLEIFVVTQGILGIIFLMSLSSALFVSYFSYEDEEDRKAVAGTAMIFLIGISLPLSLILIAIANRFSLLFFDSTQYAFYFQLIFLTLLFDTLIQISFAIFRAREESKTYAAVSLLRFVVGAGLNTFFVVGLHEGVLGILWGGLIAAAFLFLLLVPYMVKRIKLRFSKSDLIVMLRFGLPLVPGSFAIWVLTLSDRYFLQFLSTPYELGLYSLGYRFGLIIYALIVGPFTLAWGPFYWSMAKQKKAKEVYSSVLTYFVLISVFAALGLSVLSKEVIAVITTSPFHDAYKIIPLIALSYVLYGCFYNLNIGFILQKKTKYASFIIGAAAILNLGLNYLLIPGYGMMGAAVATAISYLVLPIGAYFVSRRYYPINYEWGRIAKVFIAAALVYTGSIFISNDSAIIAGVLKLITLLGFPVLLFLFRFFKPEEIQKAGELFRAAYGNIKLKLAKERLPREK